MCETQLGAELAEQSYASSDPVLSRHVGVECHGDDVVGGVAGGGQSAPPLTGLVDRRYIAHPSWNVLALHRFQPHLNERRNEEALQKANDGSDEATERQRRQVQLLVILLLQLVTFM